MLSDEEVQREYAVDSEGQLEVIKNRLRSRHSQVRAAGHAGTLHPELIAPQEVQLLRAIVP